MTPEQEEAIDRIAATIHAQAESNKRLLLEERAEREKLKEEIDLLRQRAEDTALFGGGGDSYRHSGERALGGLPIGNPIPHAPPLTSEHAAELQGIMAQMQVSQQPAGGYLVSPAIERRIGSLIFDVSPVRQIARIITLEQGAGDAWEQILATSQVESGWVSELESRPETSAPDLGKIRIELNEAYSMPVSTQKLLDTSSFDVDGFLNESISERFAADEGAAFVAGSGSKQPRGFLTYTLSTDADGVRPWDQVQIIKTGVNGAFPSVSPGDAYKILMDVVQSLKAPYRRNAAWLMNRATMGVLMKEFDADGRPLWQPSLDGRTPNRLLGYSVVEAEDMPALATNSLSVAFADWRRAYTIVDGPGVSLLRDPFTTKGRVKFYSTRRTGGGITRHEAVKLIQFSA